MNSDPPRLLEDPSAATALRGDLVQASDVTLEGLDHAAGLARLEAATAAGPPPAATSGASLTAKVGVAAMVVAAAAALWLGRSDPSTDDETVAAAEAPSVSGRSRAGLPASAEPTSEAVENSGVVDRTSQSSDVDEARPSFDPALVGDLVEAAADEAAADEARAAADGAAADEVAADEPVADRADDGSSETRAARAARRKAPRAEPARPEPSTEPGIDDVLREARTVASARASLATDPRKALRLAEEAEKDFPDGQLVEERRAIAIRALAALGRMDEARDRATGFLARFGRGAHAKAVRRAIAEP